MIAQLTGVADYRSIDHLVLNVGGVGYRVIIPLSTFYALPEQGPVTLQIHTHVKEDAFQLFGFLTEEEKELFALLIGVSGVGPKLAVNILSNIPTLDLCNALAEGDSKRLASIPGIGKKTSERLVVDLREKVTAVPATATSSQPQTATAGQKLDDALSALLNLGYRENQARKVLEAMDLAAETSVEEILKGALRLLVK